MKRIILSTLMLISLSACGSLGEKFNGLETPNSNEAIVYFYRPSSFIGSGVYYDIEENNNKIITTMYNGGYTPHRTSVGKQNYTASTETEDKITINAKGGEIYFIKGKVKMGILMGRPNLTLMPKDAALEELKDCRIIEQD